MENNREKLSQAADLLRQASDMIRSIPSGDNTASRTSSSTETTTGTIAGNLSRARSMGFTTSRAFFVSARKQIPDCQRLRKKHWLKSIDIL